MDKSPRRQSRTRRMEALWDLAKVVAVGQGGVLTNRQGPAEMVLLSLPESPHSPR